MDKSMEEKLNRLKKMANQIKSDPNIRHIPNQHDIAKCLENTELMHPYQDKTITL